MTKGRLEAFSDGVVAILITILVLELKTPHGENLEALMPVVPVFVTYVLSFVFLGIYWSNHHHLLHMVTHVNGSILWANLHLMFWLSMVPFVTGWMGENHFAPTPVAAYGVVLLLSGLAYRFLTQAVISHQGPNSKLAAAIGKDTKGWVSLVLYLAAIGLAFVNRWVSCAIYASIALMWLVPDRRIESKFKAE